MLLDYHLMYKMNETPSVKLDQNQMKLFKFYVIRLSFDKIVCYEFIKRTHNK